MMTFRFGLLLSLSLGCSRTETAPIAAEGEGRDAHATLSTAAATGAVPTGALTVDASAPIVDASSAMPDAGTGPLRTWMKRELGPTFASRKLPETAQLLDKLSGAKPSGMPNWQSIAKDGAAAARAGNVEATKASCRGCHDQYKAKYSELHRALPFP